LWWETMGGNITKGKANLREWKKERKKKGGVGDSKI